jgi:cytosine/adenosine deaminase-related metal-dependent hydrolase
MTDAYRARWIVPVEGAPIERAVLLVDDGRIVAVRPSYSGAVIDLGNVALIPGLVNAHTHLEFSGLAEPLSTDGGFIPWLERVIDFRRFRHSSKQPPREAIRAGLQESLAQGTTLLGEIATDGWKPDDYRPPIGPRVVVFQELIGLGKWKVKAMLQFAAAHQQRPRLENDPIVRWGLSPHAPYTVAPEVLSAARELILAERDGCLAIHLAELDSERELLSSGQGPLRAFLERLDFELEGRFGGRSFDPFLEALDAAAHGLLIHGHYLNEAEIRQLAQQPHTTLVYCPRTHAAFGHPPNPWKTIIELGGSVALGTDSRASNPDLSLWQELQFLSQQSPEVLPHSLLKLGTLNGARALGCARECGSLIAGKRADVAVVALEAPAFIDPLTDLLLPGNVIAGTMLGGEWVCPPAALL